MPENRRLLQELEIDDVVFHYGGPYVRAVSRVVSSAIDWPRPTGYPYGPRESETINDDGKLVRVELISSDLKFHRDEVAQLISHGTPGPLSQYGVPREAYISPLAVDDGEALLTALGVSIPNATLPGRPHEDWSRGSGLTDADAIVQIRKEQAALRAFLLDGADKAVCAICGRGYSVDVSGCWTHRPPLRAGRFEAATVRFGGNARLPVRLRCPF